MTNKISGSLENKTTYNKLYLDSINKLQEAGIKFPNNEVYMIIEHITNLTKSEIILKQNDIVDYNDLIEIQRLVDIRSTRVPLQQILGFAYFCSRKFIVSKDTLIPRFDTETIIDVFNKYKPTTNSQVLDLCTGTGCIGITLDLMFDNIDVTCSDISRQALDICKLNKKLHNSKVQIVYSDMFQNINNTFDYIICNPPYISLDEINSLETEVKDYDPMLALTDNKDGLSFYKIIADNVSNFLNPNGYLILEIGCNQFENVKNILEETNLFCDIIAFKDISNLDRVVLAH